MNAPKLRVWRYRLILGGMIAAAAALSLRALDLQVLHNDFLQNQGYARHLRVIPIPAHRGMITDRNGEPLAVSAPVDTVWADPKHLVLDQQGWSRLAKALDMPAAELKAAVASRRDREFVYLKRHINPDQAVAVRALDLPGVSLQREFRRYYPAGEVAGHVVGLTNVDDRGQEGLELAMEERLRGVPGRQRVIKDRLGRIVERVDLLQGPNPGQGVQVSIDRRIQFLAYRELKATMLAHRAKSGSVVVLDAQSGEVLAMVNQPSYNPNRRDGLHLAAHTRNRAVTDLFEPGSTVKPFAVAAALRSGRWQPTTRIDTRPGHMRLGRNTIRDVHDYGVIDVATVIQKSSNIGVAKMALNTPRELLWQTFHESGFGVVSGSGFPGESGGYVPHFGRWRDIDQATFSFGYGLSVTPLQLAQAYAVLANGGYWRPVSFLKVEEPSAGKRVLGSDVVAQVRDMLESVVDDEGTGTLARVPGYRIAGKTGTVRKSGVGGYVDENYVAVFAGMAPASRPRLVMVVVIQEPNNGKYYGGQVAAPVFGNVMAGALRLLDIAPDAVPEPGMRVAGLEVGHL